MFSMEIKIQKTIITSNYGYNNLLRDKQYIRDTESDINNMRGE